MPDKLFNCSRNQELLHPRRDSLFISGMHRKSQEASRLLDDHVADENSTPTTTSTEGDVMPGVTTTTRCSLPSDSDVNENESKVYANRSDAIREIHAIART